MVRFYWNLKPNISICLPIIKEYKIGLVVYCDVWDNHCYTRSHVKSFSKLKKFVRISKCPLQKWRSDNKYKLWGQPFRINNIFMMYDLEIKLIKTIFYISWADYWNLKNGLKSWLKKFYKIEKMEQNELQISYSW